MRLGVIGTLIFLGGCAVANPISAPSGRAGFAVDCSMPIGVGWHNCYQKAGELCGARGYDIIDRAGTGDKRTLVISCK